MRLFRSGSVQREDQYCLKRYNNRSELIITVMLSCPTDVCFSYFVPGLLFTQSKPTFANNMCQLQVSQSLIPVSLVTVTLRCAESFLSKHSKTANVAMDC